MKFGDLDQKMRVFENEARPPDFILHGSRAIDGVDPENSWLGADFGAE